MNDYSALAGRIQTSLQDVKRSVERSLELANKAQTTGEDGFWDGVALNLHAYYTGIEHIFEDIARTIEIQVPSGSAWHVDLLTQMSEEIKEIRPAVIEGRTRKCLDEYRGLRHVVRNVYAFNLRSARLHELIADLPDCFNAVQRDLITFAQFLESV